MSLSVPVRVVPSISWTFSYYFPHRFLSSRRGSGAVTSSFSVRFFSYCNAPAATLYSWTSNFTSLFHSFQDNQNGASRYRKSHDNNMRRPCFSSSLDAWANSRQYWIITDNALELIQGPYREWLQGRGDTVGCLTMFPQLYFCYDFKTHLVTVLTSDLNLPHRSMIKICGDQGEGGVRARADPFSFVVLWYEAIFESYRRAAEQWQIDSYDWVSALRRVGLSAAYDWPFRIAPGPLRTTLIMKSALRALKATVE
jgi:hypothetical protein